MGIAKETLATRAVDVYSLLGLAFTTESGAVAVFGGV
jgi:hypothetical protein